MLLHILQRIGDPITYGYQTQNVKSAKGEKPCLGGIMWFNKRSFCFLPNKTRGKQRQHMWKPLAYSGH